MAVVRIYTGTLRLPLRISDEVSNWLVAPDAADYDNYYDDDDEMRDAPVPPPPTTSNTSVRRGERDTRDHSESKRHHGRR